jgi:hypothetical protein
MKFITPDWPFSHKIQAYTSLRHTNSHQELIKLLNLPSEPIWLKQIHSNNALEAKDENLLQEADASFTDQTNKVCVVATADCLPLLVCNKAASWVAAIHGGWRGLASGIIAATLKNYPGKPEDLFVWMGPAISQENFVVGLDVYSAFTSQDASLEIAFRAVQTDKWVADLYTIAAKQLNQFGVSRIFGANYCTYRDKDLFFSYRREKEQAGRMASLIWIAS